MYESYIVGKFGVDKRQHPIYGDAEGVGCQYFSTPMGTYTVENGLIPS